jgi:hypothetical protein
MFCRAIFKRTVFGLMLSIFQVSYVPAVEGCGSGFALSLEADPESQRLQRFYTTTVESHDDNSLSNKMMTAYHNDA